MAISNEYATELIESMRADIEGRDELTGAIPPDPRDLLLVKLYDDLKTLSTAMAFLGGGIKSVTKVDG